MKKPKLKVNTFSVMRRAVEEGVNYGYQRAHKHTDKPSFESVVDYIEQAVVDAMCEVFWFEGDEE